MALAQRVRERVGRVLGTRAVLGVAGLTILLTCAFVGLLAFASPETPAVGSRLAYYVLVMAVVFVVAVFRLDDRERQGTSVLSAVTAVSVAAFVLVTLAVEGVIYAFDNPGALVASQLILYVLAAALICTGVSVWGLHHWREFAADAE
jgi:FtsH-binding integral membrane protein